MVEQKHKPLSGRSTAISGLVCRLSVNHSTLTLTGFLCVYFSRKRKGYLGLSPRKCSTLRNCEQSTKIGSRPVLLAKFVSPAVGSRLRNPNRDTAFLGHRMGRVVIEAFRSEPSRATSQWDVFRS